MLRTVFLSVITLGLAILAALIMLLPTPTTSGEPGNDPSADNSVHSGNSFAIRDARIFDGARMIEHANLIVIDGRIADMGPDVAIPDTLATIEAEGATVLPGLIDAHTHTFGDALKDSLRFGATTNLDMFTSAGMLDGQKERRESIGETQEADLFSAGVLATAPGGHGTQFGLTVETLTAPEDAEDWVARRIAEGSDYIKLVYMPYQDWFPSLDRPTAAAVIRAAHGQGVLAVAHISSLRGAQDMADEDIDGLVHIFADELASSAFIEDAARRDIFVIPTLSIIASVAGNHDGAAFSESAHVAPYLTTGQAQSLSAGFNADIPGFNLDIALQNVRLLHDAGVDVLAGSDAPNPGTAHGASVHHELQYLVAAGLSPQEAIRAATSKTAARFGLQDRGALTPGGRADIVIVDGDPSKDITATLDIVKVIKNGYDIDRSIVRQASASVRAPAALGTFDEAIAAPAGFVWAPTDDRSFGGASVAETTYIGDGADGSGGAMRVAADVRAGFFVPWAGAYFGPGPDAEAALTLSGYQRLHFAARGRPGVYRVMFFTADAAAAPPTQSFDITEDWRDVTLELASFEGFSPDAFAGLAIVAGPDIGEFQFDIDSVRFEE